MFGADLEPRTLAVAVVDQVLDVIDDPGKFASANLLIECLVSGVDGDIDVIDTLVDYATADLGGERGAVGRDFEDRSPLLDRLDDLDHVRVEEGLADTAELYPLCPGFLDDLRNLIG